MENKKKELKWERLCNPVQKLEFCDFFDDQDENFLGSVEITRESETDIDFFYCKASGRSGELWVLLNPRPFLSLGSAKQFVFDYQKDIISVCCNINKAEEITEKIGKLQADGIVESDF